MSGRCLSIFFSPLDVELVVVIDRLRTVLEGVQNEPWPLTPTGWASLVQDEETGEWVFADSDDLDAAKDTLGNEGGAAWSGTLKIRGFLMHTRFTVFRVSAGPDSMGLTVRFGTFLDRLLYPDPSASRAEEEPAEALLNFCLTLADELQASGFILSPNDEDVQCTVDVEEIRRAMLDPGWLLEQQLPPFEGVCLAGLSSKFLNRADVVHAWGKGGSRVVKVTTGGIVLLNFLY